MHQPLLFLLLPLILLCLATSTSAAGRSEFVAGYAERLVGETIPYHSLHTNEDQALLVRAIDAKSYIEWHTAPVPADVEGNDVTFVWMFAIDLGDDQREWCLEANGVEALRFRNPKKVEVREWVVEGPDGASLHFRGTWLDRYDDLFGYAFLRLPAAQVTPGQPVRLRVTGESANRRTWYMTFQRPLVEGAKVAQQSAVVRREEADHQPILVELVHLGDPAAIEVTSPTLGRHTFHATLGHNTFLVPHPVVTEPSPLAMRVQVGTHTHDLAIEVQPVRPWTVHLVQHTHTDIGYTRPATDILPEHLRFIDYALDYCDRTDHLPDDAQFRWTCEASWPVREWLRSRPEEQIDRLRRRVQEGRIEVTGMFANMSEITDEAGYPAFLAPVAEIRAAGIDVSCAMQNDVNGLAWLMADWLPEIDIRHVSMGQHGHRALVPFDLPTCFWWESPAGKRVLAHRADHYMTGNRWGLHTGRIDTVRNALLGYLGNLEEKGHPFDCVAVHYSGFMTDNSPPSLDPSEFIYRWNDRFRWPRLRAAVVSDYLRWVEEHHAGDVGTHRAAWPDWWTDGAGSAARETAAVRVTQSEMIAVEGLLAMMRLAGIEVPTTFLDDIEEIRDALIFYGEHTYGAAESVTDPECENSMVQWGEKSSYAWEAVKRTGILREKVLGRIQADLPRGATPTIAVINPLGFARSGYHEVYVDHDVIDPAQPFRLVDEEGNRTLAHKVSSRPDGTRWGFWVRDVPGFGRRSLRVENITDDIEPVPPPPLGPHTLSNHCYEVQVDPETGAVTRWTKDDRELLDGDAKWQAGQLVLERLGNRHQMEAFRLDDFTRSTATDVRVGEVRHGPVWDSIEVTGNLPGAGGDQPYRCEYRLYKWTELLEIRYSLRLSGTTDPEGIYVAFPFAFPEAEVTYETLGGLAAPDKDLLPRCATDWQAVQGFARVHGPNGQIVLMSEEIPLMQFGGIQTGRFADAATVERPHVYSWVTNNYWTTNFRASQEGELVWSYWLTADSKGSVADATRTALATRVPFLSRVLPAGKGKARPSPWDAPLNVGGATAVLLSAHPAPQGSGALLHFREVEGAADEVLLTPGTAIPAPLRQWTSNALGERGEVLDGAIPLGPCESRFVLVEPSSPPGENIQKSP